MCAWIIANGRLKKKKNISKKFSFGFPFLKEYENRTRIQKLDE